MSKLFFPSPAGRGTNLSLNPNPTSSSASSTSANYIREPPNNFAEARIRSAARELRRENTKISGPFVPSKGKLKDISDLSIEDLKEMMLRNDQLLNSPSLLAALPTGNSKLLSSQARILSRINELEELSSMRKGLQSTHLDDSGNKLDFGDLLEDLPSLVEPISPRTKQRLASMSMVQTDSKLTTMSLSESMALQRIAASRAKEESARRAMKIEIDSQRSQSVGGLLKGAMKGNAEMSGFMFHEDSDDEDDDDFGLLDEVHQEEEEEELNPGRNAYISGYERAEAEIRGES